ncbi:hypothetical protein A1O3_00334 [Capronia epimyces CBS 606.96]|uniref:Xylanolytic transcriptional activator regulatory domain-containing protein n=1 Tax=Capronia epimyces CBS 606.96 TaxID=1182542 RepID=W9ZB68_9EURO|nr:uncharacterized protein A1O3_00334 [Capronia epimyces CBS 606.96]EXJ91784.1 hypothetical protein A1O3_00334 [Capronia epimyces CBS 606.96]
MPSVTAKHLPATIVSEPTEVSTALSHALVVLYCSFTEGLAAACVSQDPATKRRHPRGYLESLEKHNSLLENHVAFLERKIRQLQPGTDIDLLDNCATDEGTRSEVRDEIRTHSPSRSPPVHDSTVSPVSGNAGFGFGESTSNDSPQWHDISNLELLCLRSAGAEPHYFGAASAYSFTKMFSASLRAVRTKGPGMTMSGIADNTVQARARATLAPLPSRAYTSMLTSAYFEQVHPQFPFLHRPTYLQWEEEVMTACESGYTPDPTKAFFVFALCAVGVLTGPLAGGSLPEGLYASAENLMEHVMQLNTLESIQAILCCAMYSIRSPVGVSLWLLSGLALRQCTELGLHRKIPWYRVDSNPLKTQIRRRVFWCCYNLDRAMSITLGRPQSITDSDIDVEYPLDIDDENITVSGLLCEPRISNSDPPTTMSAAIHTIRLRQIWARIQCSVHAQVGTEADVTSTTSTTTTTTPDQDSDSLLAGFKRELEEWLESSPSQLSSSHAQNNSFGSREWFDMMYHHSILLLYRYRLTNQRNNRKVPSAIYLECAQSSALLCAGYRQLYVSDRLHDTWGGLHNLFLGGVTFLYCLWSSPDMRAQFRLDKVTTTCTACAVVLSIMAERWAAAAPYRDAFDMLSNATLTMVAESGLTCTQPTFPVLSCSANDRFSGYLSHMAEVGIGASVEELLSSMLES